MLYKSQHQNKKRGESTYTITSAGVFIPVTTTGFGVEMIFYLSEISHTKRKASRPTLVTTEVTGGMERNELQNEMAFEPSLVRSATKTSTIKHSSDVLSRTAASRTSVSVQPARFDKISTGVQSKC